MDDGKTTLPHRPIDQLIANLCATIGAQREQIVALEALAQSKGDDCESMRLVCHQALAALRDERDAYTRLRDQYERLVTENRALRRRSTQPMERAA